MQAPNIHQSSYRSALMGAALAAVLSVGLSAGAAAAMPTQPEGCSVAGYLSSFSIDDYVLRLAVNGTDIVACAEYLELQIVDNRLVLSRAGHLQMIAMGQAQQAGN